LTGGFLQKGVNLVADAFVLRTPRAGRIRRTLRFLLPRHQVGEPADERNDHERDGDQTADVDRKQRGQGWHGGA
jgi:hypothetical protein